MESGQSVKHIKGEVDFRAKLACQHVGGENVLPDYYSKEDVDASLQKKMDQTRCRMKSLVAAGVDMSLCVEFGAERGQRALVLENEFEARTLALDISFHQLRTTGYYAKRYGMAKLPLRICCDANQPPLRDQAFSFAFCYEFLHHFTSPKPIVQNILRLLRPKGLFLFEDEPIKRWKIRLYRQKHKVSSPEYRVRNRWLRYLEKFISEEHCDEREFGIMENDEISPGDWIRALDGFHEIEAVLSSLGGAWESPLRSARLGVRTWPHALLGGLIRGSARKPGQADASALVITDPLQALCCPECAFSGLQPVSGMLKCPACSRDYPIVDGVILLLPDSLFRSLYPDMAPQRIR